MPRPISPALCVATGGLALNVVFGMCLWQNYQTNKANFARIEQIMRTVRQADAGDAPAPADQRATREDRMAFLLAVAGNADESKRVLADVSTAECAEMFRTLLARPAAGDRNGALDALCQQLTRRNPARAVALLAEVPEATLRATLAVHATDLWTDQNPADAAQWLDHLGERFLPRETLDAQFARAVTRWAAYDPAGATRFLAGRPTPGKETLAALANSAVEWGRQDPTTALAWTQNVPASDPRRLGLVQSILAGWAEGEPARAAAYLQERLYDGGEGSELYYSTVGLLADRWASVDPPAAARWASVLPSRRARRDAVRRVAAAWAASDLSAASRWAVTLPADPARSAAWQAIINAWPGNDLDGEGAWLSGLPAAPDRDRAMAAHAGRLAAADPVKALTWARTISDPAVLGQTIDAILAGWERTDLVAARNWAAANDVVLPPR